MYLDVKKKFLLRTSIPDFFTIFQKLRSFPFKYTVESRIISLRSSMEDFYILALCEVACDPGMAIGFGHVIFRDEMVTSCHNDWLIGIAAILRK